MDDIVTQEDALVRMVLWMLDYQVIKLRGLQQHLTDEGELRGIEKAIESIEATIEMGMTVDKVRIEKVVDEVRKRHKIQGN